MQKFIGAERRLAKRRTAEGSFGVSLRPNCRAAIKIDFSGPTAASERAVNQWVETMMMYVVIIVL